MIVPRPCWPVFLGLSASDFVVSKSSWHRVYTRLGDEKILWTDVPCLNPGHHISEPIATDPQVLAGVWRACSVCELSSRRWGFQGGVDLLPEEQLPSPSESVLGQSQWPCEVFALPQLLNFLLMV